MRRTTRMSVLLVALVIGLIVSLQFRTAGNVDIALPLDRVQELTIEKNRVERELAQLIEEAADLEDKLEEASKGQTEAVAALQGELAKMRLFAGLLPAEGPGLEITLATPPEFDVPGGFTGFYAVKDDDLLKVINDLRGSGAEAIAINGQRILASSEVRLAGSHINVNLVRLSPPYQIVAIGNPANLKSSLEIKGGLVEYLRGLGLIVELETQDKLEVPAYSGVIRFEHSRLMQKE